ncbi:MAG: hypothetical protein A2297_04385 [Elusimicrobia bacterium RIFOXYB2_FULL_48_7]|nr:MAG: hypothetical protein A2297_04385 [Elusimicrobia bacterium RIFOXYB2_FULL_48_7]
MPRIFAGNIPVDILSWEEILSKIESFISTRTPSQVVTLNSLMYNSACDDAALEKSMINAALVLPDSIGIAVVGRILAGKTGTGSNRKPGIDLVHKICERSVSKKWKIFLLGSRQEIVAAAAETLKKKYPGIIIAGFRNGFFNPEDEQEVISQVSKSGADVLFVGLDLPRQEKWISDNLRRLNVPVAMGVGGSFDVISGKLKRAPRLMQALGMEWFYRFIQEPWRIKRIKDLPLFALKAVKICLKSQ